MEPRSRLRARPRLRPHASSLVHVRGISVCAVATDAACEWGFAADVVVAFSSSEENVISFVARVPLASQTA